MNPAAAFVYKFRFEIVDWLVTPLIRVVKKNTIWR